MARNDFKLIAISVRYREYQGKKPGTVSRRFEGWSIIGSDFDTVTKPGQMVKLDGTAGINPAYVVRHLPDRRLLIIKHDGYSSWLNRGSGLGYSPACFRIYEYDVRTKPGANEGEVFVSLFGIAELPLSWKPEWAGEN
jgi:hypothetical protein